MNVSSLRSVVEKPSWSHYYQAPLTWRVHFWNVLHHLPLFLMVRSLKPKRVIEIGAGTGSTSIFLSYFIKDVLSIDLSPEIVTTCRQINPGFLGRAHYRQMDARDLSSFRPQEFDVCLSQGFFEHFDDAQIAEFLREQLKVSRYVVFSVPNRKYGVQDFGDERLMDKAEWDDLLGRLGFRVVESRDYAPIHFAKPWRLDKNMYAAVVAIS